MKINLKVSSPPSPAPCSPPPFLSCSGTSNCPILPPLPHYMECKMWSTSWVHTLMDQIPLLSYMGVQLTLIPCDLWGVSSNEPSRVKGLFHENFNSVFFIIKHLPFGPSFTRWSVFYSWLWIHKVPKLKNDSLRVTKRFFGKPHY